EPPEVPRDEEPVREVRDTRSEGHPRSRLERPEARSDDERALDREPAEAVPACVPDLDLHVRDRPDEVEQGRRAAEVPLLGRDQGPDLRPEAALPADPEDRARRRGEDDLEDQELTISVVLRRAHA